jgi:hypothetical protein
MRGTTNSDSSGIQLWDLPSCWNPAVNNGRDAKRSGENGGALC